MIEPTQLTPIIEVRNLWTIFDTKVVHQDLNLTVNKERVVTLIGPSGAGKSVLLWHIAGLTRPTRGTIKLFGKSLFDASYEAAQQIRSRFSLMFQGGALFSALNVFDNVAFPLREAGGLSESLIRDLVYFKLEQVELEASSADLMPSELSGGMIKRVALARSLALEPELLLLDEPTAGLDPQRAEGFVNLIQSIRQSIGLTVLMVTHDIDTMYALSDEVAVLGDKHILFKVPINEFAYMDSPFVKSFLSSRLKENAKIKEA